MAESLEQARPPAARWREFLAYRELLFTLALREINIEMISTSPIRISCVVRKGDAERAVRSIHARFGLQDQGDDRPA